MMWYWADRNRPNLEMAQTQHDGLEAVLEAKGVEVVHLEDPRPKMTKSIFTRNPAIITKGGAIICRIGIDYRRGEEAPFSRPLANLGMPILHTIHRTGLMEGGSFARFNPHTAVVGIDHRSELEGAPQPGEVSRSRAVLKHATTVRATFVQDFNLRFLGS